MEENAERLRVKNRTLEQQLSNMKTNSAELEHMLQKSHAEKISLEDKLKDNNNKLQQLLEDQQHEQQQSQQLESLKSQVSTSLPPSLLSPSLLFLSALLRLALHCSLPQTA